MLRQPVNRRLLRPNFSLVPFCLRLQPTACRAGVKYPLIIDQRIAQRRTGPGQALLKPPSAPLQAGEYATARRLILRNGGLIRCLCLCLRL